MALIACFTCGGKVSTLARACPHCGTLLSAPAMGGSPPPVPLVREEARRPATPPTTKSSPPPPLESPVAPGEIPAITKKGASRARPWVRVAAVAFVVLAALGIYWAVRGSNAPNQDVAEAPPAAPIVAEVPRLQLGYTIGSNAAPVEIQEFSDFQCPPCAAFANDEMPYIRERLIANGRVRWRFMDFPLEGHTNSPTAHLAVACAEEQGKFLEMKSVIYERQSAWDSVPRPDVPIRGFAGDLGLDLSRYDSCMETSRAQPRVDADYIEGQRLGVSFTPTFVVNGTVWPTALNHRQIEAIVDSIEALAGVAASPTLPARR